MPLTAQEIEVGVVAYFDVDFLAQCEDVSQPTNATKHNRPFLCIQVVGSQSVWTPLTWTPARERLCIEAAWRYGGTAAWRSGTSYLNDGTTTYVGCTASFIAASVTTDNYFPHTRQRVNASGVQAVLAEIRACGGQLL
jgi:hypothetical protein